jgi:hypothetical protein
MFRGSISFPFSLPFHHLCYHTAAVGLVYAGHTVFSNLESKRRTVSCQRMHSTRAWRTVQISGSSGPGSQNSLPHCFRLLEKKCRRQSRLVKINQFCQGISREQDTGLTFQDTFFFVTGYISQIRSNDSELLSWISVQVSVAQQIIIRVPQVKAATE